MASLPKNVKPGKECNFGVMMQVIHEFPESIYRHHILKKSDAPM